MRRSLSFWLAVLAVVSAALAAAPTLHGVLAWLVCLACVILLRFQAQREGRRQQRADYVRRLTPGR
jgi:hypothetical protein